MIETNAAENLGAIVILCGTILILALLYRPTLIALVDANKKLAEAHDKSAAAQQQTAVVQQETAGVMRALKDSVKDIGSDIRAQVNTAQVATKAVILDVQGHLDEVAHKEAQAATSTVVSVLNTGFTSMQSAMSAGFAGVEQKLEQIKSDLVTHKNNSKAGETDLIQRLDAVLTEVRALKNESARQDSAAPGTGG